MRLAQTDLVWNPSEFSLFVLVPLRYAHSRGLLVDCTECATRARWSCDDTGLVGISLVQVVLSVLRVGKQRL